MRIFVSLIHLVRTITDRGRVSSLAEVKDALVVLFKVFWVFCGFYVANNGIGSVVYIPVARADSRQVVVES